MEGRSHREYLTIIAWLEQQWNEPSRSDHYLMQIDARLEQLIRAVRGGAIGQMDLNEHKIPFSFKSKKSKKVIAQEAQERRTAVSKARWSRGAK